MTTRSSTTPDAGDAPAVPDRVRLMFANQTEWLVRYAATGQGALDTDRVWRDGDLIAALTSSTGVLILPLGRVPESDRLDVALSWLRTHGSSDVLVWSATPNPSLDLPLASRGCAAGAPTALCRAGCGAIFRWRAP